MKIPRKRDPLKFLLALMNNPEAKPEMRLRAAVAAAQYVHIKRGDGGKKEEREAAAEKAAKGRFAPQEPPKLAVVNGGKSSS